MDDKKPVEVDFCGIADLNKTDVGTPSNPRPP